MTCVASKDTDLPGHSAWACAQSDHNLRCPPVESFCHWLPIKNRGARWLSGRVSDSGARGPEFEAYRRRVVSLSKILYSPKVLVNYPGSDGSVPT